MTAQLEPGDSLPSADHVLRYVRRKFVALIALSVG